jgi:DNA modification methylase
MELNRIYNENCLETMARMPDGFIDLTVTSPPYDNLRTYNGYHFDFEPIARELYRVTKQGGVVVWVVGDATVNGSETGTSFKQALYFKEIGFNLHDTMLWYKPNPVPTQHIRYETSFEYMFVFSKGRPKTTNILREPSKSAGEIRVGHRASNGNGHERLSNRIYAGNEDKIRHNIWAIPLVAPELKGHTAPYPVRLAKDHILSWSNEGGLVYDPFMGSGTTAKAAHLLNRKWIGSEISSEYVDLANKRLEPYLMQESLFT